MNSEILKRTLAISLLGHITIFSIFSFSFGHKFPKADLGGVSFLGGILDSYDLDITPQAGAGRDNFRPLGINPERIDKEQPLIRGYYLKPAINLVFNAEKISGVAHLTPLLSPRRMKEPPIMFYPYLPYNFLLYFRNRQAVHIELMFNLISNGGRDYMEIKRKISSGNLEADLLTQRYIGHYLFIQQASFYPNKWQAVKIDLSKKDD